MTGESDTIDTVKSCAVCHNEGVVAAEGSVKFCPACGGASNPALMRRLNEEAQERVAEGYSSVRRVQDEAKVRRAARKRQRQARRKGRR